MRWKGRRRSSNVNDRRGQRGGFGAPRRRGRGLRLPTGGRRSGGGFGIGTLIMIGLVLWFLGINPLQLLGGGLSGGLGGNFAP